MKYLSSQESSSKRGFSLHIGLDSVDSVLYGKDIAELRSPSRNATEMARLFEAIPIEPKVSLKLINHEGTRAKILESISQIAKEAQPGDYVFITFSGHGGQVDDVDELEEDAMDETWGCYDGQIIDDGLCKRWTEFREGVTVFVISDSCHSGTVLKGDGGSNGRTNDLYFQNFTKIPPQPRDKKSSVLECECGEPLKASIISISAVNDNQHAKDGRDLSKLTEAVLDILNEATSVPTYEELRDLLGRHGNAAVSRVPQLYAIGAGAEKLSKQKIFNLL